ncbi:MAG: hypothetical protein V3G42_04595 [Oscillospiraceae bacterium]
MGIETIIFIVALVIFVLFIVGLIIKIKQGEEKGKYLEELDKKLETEYSREKKSSTKIDT